VAIEGQRLNEIREGKRGIALGLYIDVDDEDWEDYSLAVPPVLALDQAAGLRVLEAIRAALDAGSATEIHDDASEAVSIVLASDLKDQLLIARLLEGFCGRTDDTLGQEMLPA
jgi:hypothetical protein